VAALALLIAIELQRDWSMDLSVLLRLHAFSALFEVSSSLHSCLIVAYAKEGGVMLDADFYYLMNALSRQIGHYGPGGCSSFWGLIERLWGVEVSFSAGYRTQPQPCPPPARCC